MHGDPKVIAALAVAIMAVPPVVNAIMAKAAQQADTEWLRDGETPLDFDFDGTPPEGDLRDGGPPRDGEGPAPPPPRPPCRPTLVGDPEPLGGPVELTPTGILRQETLPGDLAVLVDIQARTVTGNVAFVLREGTEVRWQNDAGELHLRADLALPPRDQAAYLQPAPGVVWSLEWDVGRATHDGMLLTLAIQRCVEAAR